MLEPEGYRKVYTSVDLYQGVGKDYMLDRLAIPRLDFHVHTSYHPLMV